MSLLLSSTVRWSLFCALMGFLSDFSERYAYSVVVCRSHACNYFGQEVILLVEHLSAWVGLGREGVLYPVILCCYDVKQAANLSLNPLLWDKQVLHGSVSSTFVDISHASGKNPQCYQETICLTLRYTRKFSHFHQQLRNLFCALMGSSSGLYLERNAYSSLQTAQM